MNRVFSFCNQKGGVGKTTTAINLAAGVSEKGFKVLIIDLDPQGNATSGLGVEKSACKATTYDVIVNDYPIQEVAIETGFKNISLVPATPSLSGAEVELVSQYGREFVLQNKLESIVDQYDYIFIDCPPSLGLLTVNALVASDAIIVPLQCEYYALEGLGQLLNTFNLIRERLNEKLEICGVVLNLADFRTNLTNQVIEEVKNYFGDKVFKTIVPRSVRVSEAPSFGKPAIFYDRYNKGSLTYLNVTKEFIERTRSLEEEEPVSEIETSNV
ncbi:ParA family protein [Candidatus Omnitrophota bacterium]